MPHILIVDDDSNFRRVVALALTQLGHTVDEAGDGVGAMRRYAEKGADVVILDLIMPEKEGLETLTHLLRLHPAARVIAMSGGTQRIAAGDCLNLARHLGARHALQKPFHTENLVRAVNDALADVDR